MRISSTPTQAEASPPPHAGGGEPRILRVPGGSLGPLDQTPTLPPFLHLLASGSAPANRPSISYIRMKQVWLPGVEPGDRDLVDILAEVESMFQGDATSAQHSQALRNPDRDAAGSRLLAECFNLRRAGKNIDTPFDVAFNNFSGPLKNLMRDRRFCEMAQACRKNPYPVVRTAPSLFMAVAFVREALAEMDVDAQAAVERAIDNETKTRHSLKGDGGTDDVFAIHVLVAMCETAEVPEPIRRAAHDLGLNLVPFIKERHWRADALSTLATTAHCFPAEQQLDVFRRSINLPSLNHGDVERLPIDCVPKLESLDSTLVVKVATELVKRAARENPPMHLSVIVQIEAAYREGVWTHDIFQSASIADRLDYFATSMQLLYQTHGFGNLMDFGMKHVRWLVPHEKWALAASALVRANRPPAEGRAPVDFMTEVRAWGSPSPLDHPHSAST